MFCLHDGVTISSIADTSSIHDKGRAPFLERDTPWPMDSWRDRLEQAITDRDMSYREVSLAAGLSAGYVQGILRYGKEPTLDRMEKVCAVLNASIPWVLYGVSLTRENREILELLEKKSPATRKGLLALLRDEENPSSDQ